jgi:uncharacterized LabA/DUF88 family protein
MNKKKVAIFVDWENIRKGVFETATPIYGPVNYNDTNNVLQFIYSFLDLANEEVYRIFVYLCEPYGGTIGGTNYKTTPVYMNGMSFIDRLQVQDFIAIRKGSIAVRGTGKNGKPIFEQKQVDMLLGLDIAHVAYNKLSDRVLVLTCDTDIIPAMKVARTNGLQVIWGCCSDIQPSTPNAIKKHSDFIRETTFASIFKLPSPP